jgi:hypothetical protein
MGLIAGAAGGGVGLIIIFVVAYCYWPKKVSATATARLPETTRLLFNNIKIEHTS